MNHAFYMFNFIPYIMLLDKKKKFIKMIMFAYYFMILMKSINNIKTRSSTSVHSSTFILNLSLVESRLSLESIFGTTLT